MELITKIYSTVKLYFNLLTGNSNNIKNLSFTKQKINRQNIFASAFTLAEVLISITIIGVIAALTLPAISVNVQKRSTITALKKAQTTLIDASRLMAVEENTDFRNTYCGLNRSGSSDEDPGNKCLEKWLAQISTEKSKKYNKKCDEAWCKYKVDPDKMTYRYDSNYAAAFQTTDSITYLFLCGFYGDVAVDTNGTQKGPNIGGHDIFRFYIDYDNERIIPGGSKNDPANTTSSDKDIECTNANYSDKCTADVLSKSEIKYY